MFDDFPSIILLNREWGLLFSGIRGWGTPVLREYLTSNGKLNLFGLNENYPYVSLSDTIQEEAVALYNEAEIQQKY